MLTMRTTSEGHRFFIREIPAIYAVGHTQPHMEVPQDKTRVALHFTKNRLLHYLFKQFQASKEATGTAKADFQEVKDAFPDISDTTIKKHLKDLCNF